MTVFSQRVAISYFIYYRWTTGSSDTVESCGERGLLLVAALSSTWGALRTNAGQLVWAELVAD
ncbi:hypothetical protein [Kitasatospora sp. NPDC056181]|uniref:hypothetical protein n=1 Tax=Kitasatospora sp. NPDC056181 TaxID=3345737 RepID=UPI0035DB3203